MHTYTWHQSYQGQKAGAVDKHCSAEGAVMQRCRVVGTDCCLGAYYTHSQYSFLRLPKKAGSGPLMLLRPRDLHSNRPPSIMKVPASSMMICADSATAASCIAPLDIHMPVALMHTHAQLPYWLLGARCHASTEVTCVLLIL